MNSKILNIIAIVLFSILSFSCQETKIGDVDLDFDINTSTKEIISYVGKPSTVDISLDFVDSKNNYPLETKIKFANGILKVNGENKNSEEKFSFDYKAKGTLKLEFTPTKTGESTISVNIKNERVDKMVNINVNCIEALYQIEIKDAPVRPLIDTKFDFSLLVKEAEKTGADSIVAYAKVVKGSGFVYNGETLINDGLNDTTASKAAKSALLVIGKNNITYKSTKEGENVIRFFFTNKYGYETFQDVSTNVFLPEWVLSDSENRKIVDVPYQDNYSFTLNLNEKDIFKDNSYEGFFRILSNTDLTLKINDKPYSQGATIPLKAGGNVGVLNVKATGEGAIEFIVKDKYKQQNKDTLRFTSKLPLKPIEASLDKSSLAVKINQPASFKLTLNEINYSDIFSVKYAISSGTGSFEGGTAQSLSAGTHTLKYTPTAAGSHTFKITVTDKNNQSKELSATVQASLSPLSVTNSQSTLNLVQKEKGSSVVTMQEADYTGKFYLKYAVTSGTGGDVIIGNRSFGAGGVAIISDTEMPIYITPSALGTTVYTFTLEDDYKQSKDFTIKVITKGQITAAAGPGGTISGGGNFDLNQSCTLKATPNTGYSFLGWYKNGGLVSNQASYTFSVTESLSLEARFSTNSYTVAATAETGGSVSGAGTYEHGKSCTLKASVNTGYTFDGWYEGNTKVSSALEYTFVVSSNKTFVAKFKGNSYNITANATTGGTVTGGGTFEHGKTASLTATAKTGYSFIGWYLNGTEVSKSPTYTFSVTGPATYEAKFSANTFAITVNAQAGGSTTGGGNYSYGDNITVKAIPDANYDFVGWYEDNTQVSISLSYNFAISKARTLEARFKLKQYQLTVSATTGGTATGGGTFDYNTTSTITAAPKSGYAFNGWYENGTKISGNLSYVVKISGNRTIEARFEANKLGVIVNADTGGTATGSGAYSYDANCTVTASPSANYTFGGWYDGSTQVSASLSYTFKVTKETTLTAKFIVNKYTVTVTGTGTQTGAGSYDWNTNATVKATAPANQEFVGWYEGGTQVSTTASYTFKVTKDIILEARYQLVKYTLSVASSPTEGGTVTGGTTVEHGKAATVKATANTNYTFDGWYNGATRVSTDATYVVTVTSNMSLVAKFTANKFNVTANAQAGGTVLGGGSYDYNSSVTVKATPNTNYSFAGWYNGTTKVSDSQNYTFTVTGNVTLEARFTPAKFTVTVNALTGGTVSGSGSFDYNANVNVSAVVGTGYVFDGWYNGATRVSTSLSYTFVLTGNITLTAKFTAKTYSIIVNAGTGGTATGGGTAAFDTNKTITASPSTGYAFSGWYEGGTQVSTTASYTFKVDKDRTIEARFTANKFNIVVNAGTGGSATGSGSVAYGTNTTVTATPSTGYDFDGWYNGTARVSTNLSYTFTVTSTLTLEARFAIKKYSVTLSGVNGTQTGAGSYNYNTNATLSATPSTGYDFLGWYEGTSQLSTSNPYIFAVTKDRIIEAKYQLNKIVITATAATGGTATGGGTFDYGKSISLTATPSAGYIFDGWYEGNTKVSSSASYTFTVSAARTLQARFVQNVFNISISAGTGGTVTGGGNIFSGTSTTVTATPAVNYYFDGWYEGNTKVSSSASYTFTVSAARTLQARFIAQTIIELELDTYVNNSLSVTFRAFAKKSGVPVVFGVNQNISLNVTIKVTKGSSGSIQSVLRTLNLNLQANATSVEMRDFFGLSAGAQADIINDVTMVSSLTSNLDSTFKLPTTVTIKKKGSTTNILNIQ